MFFFFSSIIAEKFFVFETIFYLGFARLKGSVYEKSLNNIWACKGIWKTEVEWIKGIISFKAASLALVEALDRAKESWVMG